MAGVVAPVRLLMLMAVVVCLFGSVRADWIPRVRTANMTGVQTVTSTGNNTGAAVCVLSQNRDPPLLDCTLHHQSLPLIDVLDIYIGRGARGRLGEKLVGFTGPFSNTAHFRQVFELVTVNGYSVEQQEEDFLDGLLFIEIQTRAFPEGELRGQLENEHRLFCRLNSDGVRTEQGLPTTASGVAVASFSLDRPKREINLNLVHNVPRPTELQLTRGPPLVTSHSVVHTFERYVSPVNERVRLLSVQEQFELFNEDEHLSVLSAQSPTVGEIRGEMQSVDWLPAHELSFSARLKPTREAIRQADGDERGCVLITLDCVSHKLEYLVMHNVDAPIAAALFIGDEDDEGDFAFQLERARSPIFGSIRLEPEVFIKMLNQQTYIRVDSVTHREGAIQGQISARHRFAAYLSGTNFRIPRTTSAVGCATFNVIQEPQLRNAMFDYEIHHNVKRPTGVELYTGQAESEGELRREFETDFSPVIGNDEDFDDDDVRKIVREQMFVRVNSDDYAEGEIRGQIFTLRPCNRDTPPPPFSSHYLPPLFSTPPPPSRDPFVIATITIDNTTVEIRIRPGGLKNIGVGSSLLPSMFIVCCVVLLSMFCLSFV